MPPNNTTMTPRMIPICIGFIEDKSFRNITKIITRKPNSGRYARCSRNTVRFAGSTEISDGPIQSKIHTSPTIANFLLLRSTPQMNPAINTSTATALNHSDVSGRWGITESFTGMSILPRYSIVAGTAVRKNKPTSNAGNSAFASAVCRNKNHRTKSEVHPMPSNHRLIALRGAVRAHKNNRQTNGMTTATSFVKSAPTNVARCAPYHHLDAPERKPRKNAYTLANAKIAKSESFRPGTQDT